MSVTLQLLYEGLDILDDVIIRDCRFTSRANGQPGDAFVRVKDTTRKFAPGYFHAGGTLELFIDGSREWDGWVMGVSQTWAFPADDTREDPTPRFWILRGADRNLLFTRRFIFDVADPANAEGLPSYPAGTADNVVIADYLARFVDLTGDGLDTVSGVERVETPGAYEQFVLGGIGQPLAVMFDDLVKITGALYYIDPDRVLRYNDDRSVTAPFRLSDQPT